MTKSKLEKILYDVKYTACSYADFFLSASISVAEGIAKVAEVGCKKVGSNTPRFLTQEDIRENSLIYATREKLRESLDTRAGSVFLQSNIVAAVPFFVVGIPAAELAQEGIDYLISDANEIVKYITNSTATLLAQGLTGYTVFMANEVRTNREKYIGKNNKLNPKKIWKCFTNTVKAFLSFDLSYALGKIGGQSYLLSQGKDPGIASALFDAIGLPLWYAIAIPLGLHTDVIETKETQEWKRDEVAVQ